MRVVAILYVFVSGYLLFESVILENNAYVIFAVCVGIALLISEIKKMKGN